jgi:hypothetical protein
LLPTGFGEQLASWAVKTFGKPAGEWSWPQTSI